MSTKHTPGPAAAASVVRAVNCHEDLVEALKACKRELEYWIESARDIERETGSCPLRSDEDDAWLPLAARIIATAALLVVLYFRRGFNCLMAGVFGAPILFAIWWCPSMLGREANVMSERKNIVVVDRLRWEEIRRAALKIDGRKYPRHAEELAKAEARLRVMGRAA
jgi:hypothetical protein